MNNIEILSPAGSVEALYAGINAGADAVYIGGQKFGARAYAENPEDVNLLRAIDYVHMKDKKIYMTVNTLLKNNELEEQLYDFLRPFYKQGLDAVIVQDLGVFKFIKENFPEIDIHASTQMGISGVLSAEFLKEMGASRVVTERELSLNELKNIYDNVDIEIESFIHGAMCYSYSGMCLFSSIAGGRSGNRGRCAGPCRQPYEVYLDGKRINDKNSLYALSLKDMNTLSILPEIIEAGVYSLKIEGRMKSPEYAAGVVSVYRKYVDMYYSQGKEKFSISKKDMENLSGLYTRSGSEHGYYKVYNSKDMISYSKPAYESKDDNYVSKLSEKYCKGPEKVGASAYAYLKEGGKSRLDVLSGENYISVVGENVNKAMNRPLDRDTILKQLSKTGDSFFEFDNIEVEADENIFMPVKHLNEIRREAIDKLTEEILKSYRRNCKEMKKKADFKPANDNKEPNIICQVSTKEQFEAVIKDEFIKDVYVAVDYLSVNECKELINNSYEDKNYYIAMPFIFREKGIKYMDELLSDDILSKINGVVVRNIDELAYANKNNLEYIVDNSMYGFNNRAYDFYMGMGAKRVTVPYELNYGEMKNLNAANGEVIVYGNIPLMITSNCINQNFNKCDKIHRNISLKDRLNYEFKVSNCCNFCYNIIYNNSPLSLIGVSSKVRNMGFSNYRINFTSEKGKEVVKIVDKCKRAFYNNEIVEETDNFTRGHFKRGVL